MVVAFQLPRFCLKDHGTCSPLLFKGHVSDLAEPRKLIGFLASWRVGAYLLWGPPAAGLLENYNV